MKRKLALPFFVLSLFFFVSCVDDEINFYEQTYSHEEYKLLSEYLDLPEQVFDYSLNLPSHITKNVNPRPISDNMATLGRVLFYDKNLSRNGSVSCASCHKQELAFSDDRAFSLGFNGEPTARNSIALGSVLGFAATYGNQHSPTLEFGTAFFWDERAFSASEQAILSLTDNVEMGMTPHTLVNTVKAQAYYEVLFKTAFPKHDTEINAEKITFAIESFIESIGSFNSKLDKAMIAAGASASFKQNLPELSNQENHGKILFIAHCQACHGNQFEAATARVANNGLDQVYEDQGVGAISLNEGENGVFKVPTLRNVALTAPYMHDGRFESLSEVIDFYSTDIQAHPNLSIFLKDIPNSKPIQFNFSETEKRDLLAFLHTLTDPSFLSEEKYSDPFKR